MRSYKAKMKVLEFTREIAKLQNKVPNTHLEKNIKDTFDLIDNNEFGIGFENLLENLYEFEIPLNPSHIRLAREAGESMKINWEQLKFIEELVIE